MERNWYHSQVPSNHPGFAENFRCLLMQEQSARELQEVGVIGVRNRGKEMCFFYQKMTPKLVIDTRVALWKLPFSTWTWAYLIGISWSLKSEIPKTFCRSTVSKQVPFPLVPVSKWTTWGINVSSIHEIREVGWKDGGISKQGLVWSFRMDMSRFSFLVN